MPEPDDDSTPLGPRDAASAQVQPHPGAVRLREAAVWVTRGCFAMLLLLGLMPVSAPAGASATTRWPEVAVAVLLLLLLGSVAAQILISLTFFYRYTLRGMMLTVLGGAASITVIVSAKNRWVADVGILGLIVTAGVVCFALAEAENKNTNRS